MSHFYQDIHLSRLTSTLNRLPKEIILETAPLTAEFAVTPEPVPYAQRETLAYKPIQEGETWGKTWDCGWFRLRGAVPASWAGSYVTLRLDFAGEALVYDAKGCPLVGLTDGSVFAISYSKDTVHLHTSCKGREKIDLWVETGANGLFGVQRCVDPQWIEDKSKTHGTHQGVVRSLRVCRFDYERWQLWLDLQVIENLARALPEGTARRVQVLRIASKALDILPTQGAAACRAALKPIFDLPTDPATVDVYGVGHAHIDTGWLWPVRETIRKCARTFASQIGLIERYPGYVFGASQAQLYAFVKEHYPKLYAKIKAAIAAGQWEVQGGMWVEADCNLIGGESMVRQFLVGKNFFQDEFGIDVRNLWLPDVFGYSGNLPQILKKSGVDYFLTQKLSWNAYNKFPHNTFLWRGIDGSEVLAHFPPEDDYNSYVLPGQLRRHETNNREAGLVQEAMCLYGVGDGGGGPREEHVERALRCHNLNGCPRFHFGFAQTTLDKMSAYKADLDTWNGELYFELHRATLTSQADMKRWNRRAEEALRAAEMLCAAAGVAGYPWAEFDALWKLVLINQFHDIIPGSSIHRVYEEAIPQLRGVVSRCKELQAAAAAKLLRKDAKAFTLFNPSSTPFRGAVALPAGWTGATRDGEPLAAQAEADGTVVLVEVAPQGFATLLRADAKAAAAKPAKAADLTLENDRVRYVFDASLRLVDGLDKETGVRFVPADEPGNRIELFDDKPHNWDAWDIDEYVHNMKVADPEVLELKRVAGPVRCGLVAKLRIGRSTVSQQVWLERDGKRLDFVNDVDWREDHKLLRVAFPTTVVAAEARFEIQYGTVARATHDNTKWQRAQFEVPGHRYADLSEPTHGVALLNDSKFGYRVKGSELSLSLLRAPTEPDPVADRGQHRIVYSLLPHAGNLVASDVTTHAAILNQGVERLEGLADKGAALPVAVTGEGVEFAVLKRAEKEKALVVRVVETRGVRTRGRVACACGGGCGFVETDLMEWKTLGKPSKGGIEFELGPFEIKTFKVVG